MKNEKETVVLEEISWSEINKLACEEASLNDISGWYELD